MVEQTRRPNHAVTLQAGPGEAHPSTPFDINLRIRDSAARVIGCQLAVIGDQLDRERTRRDPNRPPTHLHLLRPAQTLTQTIYRDVHGQLWGFQGNLRAKALTAWGSSFKLASCTGWTRGAVITVALLAVAGLFTALWMGERT